MHEQFFRMQLALGILLSHILTMFHLLLGLKDYMNTFLRPNANSVFGIHDPIGLRFIFQLRVSLSPLGNHKLRHNVEDTPSDTCSCNQGNEDTNHFLLFCPIDIMTRAKLVASVTNILQKHNLNYLGNESHLLLYGHGSLSSFENKQILLSTIRYIRAHVVSQPKPPPPPPFNLLVYFLC